MYIWRLFCWNFNFSLGEWGKKQNTIISWPVINVVHLMTLIYFPVIIFKILYWDFCFKKNKLKKFEFHAIKVAFSSQIKEIWSKLGSKNLPLNPGLFFKIKIFLNEICSWKHQCVRITKCCFESNSVNGVCFEMHSFQIIILY